MVTSGTGTAARVLEFAAGKTGTTENSGDAWFVGFTERLTVAVWVGYPTSSSPMKTEYHGEPVAGGTFPAQIWHDFMTAALKRIPDERERGGGRPRRTPPSDRPYPRRPAPARTPTRDLPDAPVAARRPAGAARPRWASDGARAGARPGAAASRRRRAPSDDARRDADARPGGPGSRRGRHAGERRPGKRDRHGAPPTPERGTAEATRRMAAGHGADTHGLLASQKRHGSSAALVIPMRDARYDVGLPRSAGACPIRIGPPFSDVAFSSSPIPSAWVSLPGPEHRSSKRASRRRARISVEARSARARGSAPPRPRPRLAPR